MSSRQSWRWRRLRGTRWRCSCLAPALCCASSSTSWSDSLYSPAQGSGNLGNNAWCNMVKMYTIIVLQLVLQTIHWFHNCFSQSQRSRRLLLVFSWLKVTTSAFTSNPGLLEEDDIKTPRLQETKTKTCCCNRWGSSTEDSTWYLVFVVKFVDLADITINNKQFPTQPIERRAPTTYWQDRD